MKFTKSLSILIVVLSAFSIGVLFYTLSHSSILSPSSNSNQFESTGSTEYYWYSGTVKNLLHLSLDRFAVTFKDSVDENMISSLISQREFLQSYELRNKISNTYLIYLNSNSSESILLSEIMYFIKHPSTVWAGPVFSNGFILTNRIYLSAKEGVSENDILDLSSRFGLEIVLKHAPGDETIFNLPANEYFFKLPKENYEDPLSVLRISNILHESPLTEFATPDFIFPIVDAYVPNDDSVSLQTNLFQIRAPEAWDLSQGDSDVIIAVLEQAGIDFSHEDLGGNVWQNLGEDIDGDGKTFELIDDEWVFDPDDIDTLDTDGNGLKDDFIGWNFYT